MHVHSSLSIVRWSVTHGVIQGGLIVLNLNQAPCNGNLSLKADLT